MEINTHFNKDKLNNGFIYIAFLKYENHLADALLALLVSKSDTIAHKMGMRDIYAPS